MRRLREVLKNFHHRIKQTDSFAYTGHTQKNGAVSKVNTPLKPHHSFVYALYLCNHHTLLRWSSNGHRFVYSVYSNNCTRARYKSTQSYSIPPARFGLLRPSSGSYSIKKNTTLANHVIYVFLNLQLHICDVISICCVFRCRIPSWRWPKKAEACRRIALWLYIFISDCCGVVRINILKLSYCKEQG
jgi:hypothetical protein